VKTAFPPGRVATIPSAIPKNPVGSYQLWTDCIGEPTCAIVQTSRTLGIRILLLRGYRHRYRQPPSNADLAKLEEAMILTEVAPRSEAYNACRNRGEQNAVAARQGDAAQPRPASASSFRRRDQAHVRGNRASTFQMRFSPIRSSRSIASGNSRYSCSGSGRARTRLAEFATIAGRRPTRPPGRLSRLNGYSSTPMGRL
jgi:hypothetical protein